MSKTKNYYTIEDDVLMFDCTEPMEEEQEPEIKVEIGDKVVELFRKDAV